MVNISEKEKQQCCNRMRKWFISVNSSVVSPNTSSNARKSPLERDPGKNWIQCSDMLSLKDAGKDISFVILMHNNHLLLRSAKILHVRQWNYDTIIDPTLWHSALALRCAKTMIKCWHAAVVWKSYELYRTYSTTVKSQTHAYSPM